MSSGTGWVEFDGITATRYVIDLTHWTAGNNASLTKQPGAPSGLGSLVLRVAYNGTANPYAYQSIAEVEPTELYKITGYVRGDGTVHPRVYFGSDNLIFQGTPSTDWQYFIAYAGAYTTENIYLYAYGSSGYCEFDNISARKVTLGPELLTDGDMEAAGTTAWSSAGATLSKVAGSPGGSGSQVLQVAYDASANPYTYQSILTIGSFYHVSGWARGDGTTPPAVYLGTNQIWQGTSSTTWQRFSASGECENSVRFRLYLIGSSGNTQFDDISVSGFPVQSDWEKRVLEVAEIVRPAGVKHSIVESVSGGPPFRLDRANAGLDIGKLSRRVV
jgi:hypothetical protein